MRTPTKVGLLSLLVGALFTAPLSVATAGEDRVRATNTATSLTVVGLVDGTKLVNVRTDNARTRDSRDITGLDGDKSLVGVDYRVQDGKLYGVGNAGGVYSIEDRGTATKVKQLTVALDGTDFGVDFNPAANALRVISDKGQNLRQPFADLNAPTAVDGALTNPATPPATGTVPAMGVTGAGYTNNDTEASTATTLFGLDTTADRISIQSPANAGTLAPTGGLGVDAAPNAGFDVYSTVQKGVTVDLTAFATLQVGGKYALYRIDLLTGKAASVGGLTGNVTDIAIPLNQR